MNRMTMSVVAAFALLLGATSVNAAQLPDFTGIVEQNSAAVVHVEAKYDDHSKPQLGNDRNGRQQLPPGMPEIFRHFFGPGGPGGHPLSPNDLKHTSIGSGFIISSDGYILTNDHVVDDANTVHVRLKDRRTLTAKVVGTDKAYDIALLKVEAKDLPTVTLGDSSKLKPGQWVLAIGSPFDFDYTVTQGIVSAVSRGLGRDDQDVPFIQTDVPINRGNSGGPLFNMDGQVVGINSQIYSRTGGFMGVSFSIPINTAMNAVQQLKAKGYVTRGMIGVTLQAVDASTAKSLGMSRAVGAAITSVKPGAPGDKAGLKPSDVILAYNDHPIDSVSDLPPLVAATKPGTQATLKVFHDGKNKNVTVTIGEFPRDKDDVASTGHSKHSSAPSSLLGFTVQSLTKDQREALKLKPGQGVVISRITGEQAAEAHLRAGYIILNVGQKAVGSVKDFRAAIKGIQPGDTVLLLVHGPSAGDSASFTTVNVPDKH